MPATKTKPASKVAKTAKKTLSLSEKQTKALYAYAKKHNQDPKVLLEELIYDFLADEEDLKRLRDLELRHKQGQCNHITENEFLKLHAISE